jgi:hypothetical protein
MIDTLRMLGLTAKRKQKYMQAKKAEQQRRMLTGFNPKWRVSNEEKEAAREKRILVKDQFELENKGQFEVLYPAARGEPDVYEHILKKAKEVCDETVGTKKRFEAVEEANKKAMNKTITGTLKGGIKKSTKKAKLQAPKEQDEEQLIDDDDDEGQYENGEYPKKRDKRFAKLKTENSQPALLVSYPTTKPENDPPVSRNAEDPGLKNRDYAWLLMPMQQEPKANNGRVYHYMDQPFTLPIPTGHSLMEPAKTNLQRIQMQRQSNDYFINT